MWEGILQVLEDYCGFIDGIAVVDQNRDEPARIDLEKLRFEVLALHQVNVHALPGKILFGQRDADLLGANRYVVMI